LYSGWLRSVNHMQSISRCDGLVLERFARQKSEPHDTKAEEVSVSLRVILAGVVPIYVRVHESEEMPNRC
jgi:hypothetical protein